MNSFYIFKASPGIFRLEEQNGCICLLKKIDEAPRIPGQPTPLINRTIRQLQEYFSGKRTTFSIPISCQGTDFQMRTWAMLKTIPYGQTVTYGQLAEMLGSPRGARAAGSACRCNPIQIIIPCHRVVAAGSRPGGYAGGLRLKQLLLQLEQNHPA